nr:sodium-coupled monocarboxylate transporter 1 [Onthophagus taurus]
MADILGVGLITSADQGQKIVLGMTVEDIGSSMKKFGWPDYVVFFIMLFLCVIVGVYYGFFKKMKSTQDYLVGGREMKVFPISMSLIASFISGISLLGIPTEIYVYGIQYIYIGFGIIIMGVITHVIYLPVFHNLKITSTYEYLHRRFDSKVRLLASVLFMINLFTWLPIVIYVPALAFNQVTGINIHWITSAVCIICIFYTSLGGIKAVVLTDVIQTLVMIGAMLLVAIKGTLDIGGIGVVWNRNLESGRIEGPNFDPNPLSRHTIWSLGIGGFIYMLQTSTVNQSMIQRYLSLPTLKTANKSLWLFIFGMYLVVCLCAYCGMLVYATYHQCDPLTTMLAKEKDQLLPILVMEVLGKFPGLPGLFVAGIFSAALSSLSTGLNSMAAVILEDVYKTFFRKELTQNHTYILMKGTVIIMGIICVGLVFVVEKLGAVLQLTMSINSIAAGPSLALFTMGILIPWINAKGAFIGSATSLVIMSWIIVKYQTTIVSGNLFFPEKPTSTDGCTYHFTPKLHPSINLRLNPSLNTTDVIHTDEIFMLYRLSYLWYTLIGCVISILIGGIVSFFTKFNDARDIDSMLIAPFYKKLIKPREYPNEPKSNEIIFAYDTKIRSNINDLDNESHNV